MPEPAEPAWCGAKKHQTEGTCKRPAGWGTDHPGRDRCRFHPDGDALLLPEVSAAAVAQQLGAMGSRARVEQVAAIAEDVLKLSRRARRRRPPLQQMTVEEMLAYLREREQAHAILDTARGALDLAGRA